MPRAWLGIYATEMDGHLVIGGLAPGGPAERAGVTLGDADLVRLICSDCPFYKEGEDEELECGAFMLLRHLLRKKAVTVKGILEAVQPADERRLRQGQQIVVAAQVAAPAAEALAAELFLGEALLLDHRAHGAVEDQDPLGEQRLQQ